MQATGQRDVAASLAQAADLDRGFDLQPIVAALPGVPASTSEKWWVIQRSTGLTTAVLIRASQREPDTLTEAAERQRQVMDRLSEPTASVVLTPTQIGRCEGRSFALFPYFPPVSTCSWRGRWHRWRLRRPALSWLARATAESAEKVYGRSLEQAYIEPLQHLVADTKLDGKLRRGAERALARIERRKWRPRTAVTHNDLWMENFLLAPASLSGGYGFFVIDWGLANPDGQPLYDLVRLAGSLRLSPRRLRAEVQRHCRILHCERTDAMSYLLAGLGWLRGNLNYFPHHRFVEVAYRCVTTLRTALPVTAVADNHHPDASGRARRRRPPRSESRPART